MAARFLAFYFAFSSRSGRSISPSSVVLIVTIFIPDIKAEAGLVPCADTGIKQILRCPYPVASKKFLIVKSPAYSPAAPLLG